MTEAIFGLSMSDFCLLPTLSYPHGEADAARIGGG